jgi:hypothetical protein
MSRDYYIQQVGSDTKSWSKIDSIPELVRCFEKLEKRQAEEYQREYEKQQLQAEETRRWLAAEREERERKQRQEIEERERKDRQQIEELDRKVKQEREERERKLEQGRREYDKKHPIETGFANFIEKKLFKVVEFLDDL